MGNEVVIIQADQGLPESWRACILLGDSHTTDKGPGDLSWQAELAELLRRQWSQEGLLVIILENLYEPTIKNGDTEHFVEFNQWYRYANQVADVAAYWWPADTDARLILTTWAAWRGDRPLVYGASPELMPKVRKLGHDDRNPVSVAASLTEMATIILDRIGLGAQRSSGEREVPLSVWNTDSFQRWHKTQTGVGNKLLSAKLEWTFNVGKDRPTPLFWAVHASIYIKSEDRVKNNEVVISRPDTSVMMLYRPGRTIDETVIVLVREFRAPASTPDGLVHELPGGSGEETDKLGQAIKETEDEIGLTIERRRVRKYDDRQLAATVSAHQAHLYAVEISDDELSQLQALKSAPHGVASDTELTWTEVATLREIRQQRLVDWSTIGMISQVVLDLYGDSAGCWD